MTTEPSPPPVHPLSPLQPPARADQPDSDWSSPLWGRPDTVAAGWAPRSSRAPTTVVPIATPPRRASRTILAAATAALCSSVGARRARCSSTSALTATVDGHRGGAPVAQRERPG